MAENPEIKKLKSKYPEFFAQFSPEFLEFVFSKEISLEIASICLENKIEDEEVIEKITSRITSALFNQIPEENLAKVFEKGVGLSNKIAEKISAEVKERIFSQISGLQYKKSSTESGDIPSPEDQLGAGSNRRRDAYREPVE